MQINFIRTYVQEMLGSLSKSGEAGTSPDTLQKHLAVLMRSLHTAQGLAGGLSNESLPPEVMKLLNGGGIPDGCGRQLEGDWHALNKSMHQAALEKHKIQVEGAGIKK